MHFTNKKIKKYKFKNKRDVLELQGPRLSYLNSIQQLKKKNKYYSVVTGNTINFDTGRLIIEPLHRNDTTRVMLSKPVCLCVMTP